MEDGGMQRVQHELPVLWDDGSGLCWEQGWGIGSWCVCCWMTYFILPHVHRGPPQTINWTTSACILAAEGHIILPHHGPRGGESSLPFAFHPTGRADSLLLPISTMCFTIPSPKKFQLTAIHSFIWMCTTLVRCSLRRNKNLSIHLDPFQIRPFGWGTGSVGAHTVQPHPSLGWRGSKTGEKGEKSNFATSFFMFPQSLQTSRMERTT